MASARREQLLRVHRFRLRREDLEDCFSQATLELILRARRDASFVDRRHLANALEQRFLSRIHDRRRALAGRSPIQAALEGASSLGGAVETQIDVADMRADLEHLAIIRQDLRQLVAAARHLSTDQRLVLASQIAQIPRAEACARFGWSEEKYRKVAQRGRARLRRLMASEQGAPPAGVSSVEGEDHA